MNGKTDYEVACSIMELALLDCVRELEKFNTPTFTRYAHYLKSKHDEALQICGLEPVHGGKNE